MEFGIFLILQSPQHQPSHEIYSRAEELAQAAESLQFSRLFLAEHHFSTYSYSSRPLVFLSHLAAKTKKIRLGTAIIPLPLHHPIIVAEECATVDLLSCGRLDIGIGKGYQHYQYDRLGVEKNSHPTRFSEAIEIFLKSLDGESFTYQGQHFKIPETRIYPQPYQKKPPVWLVINTKIKESLILALKNKLNVFTGVLEPISSMTNIFENYSELFEQYSSPTYIGTQRPVFVSYDQSLVNKIAEETRWNARVSLSMRQNTCIVENGQALAKPFANEPSIEDILSEFIVAGNPEQCIRQLKKIQSKLGINYFNCSFWFGAMSQKNVLKSMELFSKEVMPAFE